MPQKSTFRTPSRLLAAALCLASAATFAAPPQSTAQTTSADPLESLYAPERNYVCGELLVGLAIAGLRDYAQAGGVLPQGEASVDPNLAQIYMTGAASILMFEQAKNLDEASRSRAHELTANLVQGPAPEHIRAALSCRQTVQRWLDSGEIIEQAYEQALIQAKNTLPEISDSLADPLGLQ